MLRTFEFNGERWILRADMSDHPIEIKAGSLYHYHTKESYDEAQSEIARLHAILRSAEATISNLSDAEDAIRRTAHNDAIEAAIAVVMDDNIDDTYMAYAAAIRALKR